MFDPYRKWLGIPEQYRPPTHYQLLAIDPAEQDREVIEAAVIRQSVYLRNFQKGPQGDAATQLLTEIAAAKACLLNPAKRAAYDAGLKATTAPLEAMATVATAPIAPSAAIVAGNSAPTVIGAPRVPNNAVAKRATPIGGGRAASAAPPQQARNGGAAPVVTPSRPPAGSPQKQRRSAASVDPLAKLQAATAVEVELSKSDMQPLIILRLRALAPYVLVAAALIGGLTVATSLLNHNLPSSVPKQLAVAPGGDGQPNPPPKDGDAAGRARGASVEDLVAAQAVAKPTAQPEVSRPAESLPASVAPVAAEIASATPAIPVAEKPAMPAQVAEDPFDPNPEMSAPEPTPAWAAESGSPTTKPAAPDANGRAGESPLTPTGARTIPAPAPPIGPGMSSIARRPMPRARITPSGTIPQSLPGGAKPSVRINDDQSWKDIRVLSAPGASFTAIEYSPSGAWLALGGIRGTTLLWSQENPTEMRVVVKPNDLRQVTSLKFTPDEKHLLVAGADGVVRCYSLSEPEPREVSQFVGHTGAVKQMIVYGHDGDKVISAGADNVVRLWTWADGSQFNFWNAFKRDVQCLWLSEDENRLFASDGQWAGIAEINTKKTPKMFKVTNGAWGNASCVSSDGRYLVMAVIGNLYVVDIKTQRPLAQLTEGNPSMIVRVEISPDGRFVAAATSREINIFDLPGRQRRALLEGHVLPAAALCFSPDGRFLASCAADDTARVWRIPDEPNRPEKTKPGASKGKEKAPE
jgi:WD40 repeat protein